MPELTYPEVASMLDGLADSIRLLAGHLRTPAAVTADRTDQRILADLLTREHHLLRRLETEARTLAEPCPPGRWRCAPDPTPEEATALRAHADALAERLARVDAMRRHLPVACAGVPPRPAVTGGV